MACKDCLINCDTIVSDQCVQYTGPEIPLLGLCPGDPLSKVEANIIEELLSLLDGSGIDPAGVTISCSFLQEIIGSASPNLSNILQMLVTASCTLKELVDAINVQLESTVFNTSCLTGLPDNPTRDNILQAAINMICAIKVIVDAIPTTYVKNSDLTTLVTQIVNNINGGGGGIVQNYTKMIPYTMVAYFGPLSNFDASGIGVTSLGFEKIYICNGANGTPDPRGRTVVGAIRNVPGGVTLDAAVDPTANPNNPNWAVTDKGGETFHTLIVSEMPTHTHGVTDPGHTHLSAYRSALLPQSGNSTQCWSGATDASKITSSSTTGITLQTSGGSQPHNNIQPSISAYYIMYIP